MNSLPFISVIIKTFNEQDGIGRTIDSVRAGMGDYPHKIIVADSLSTDNTTQIASERGVTVVSLQHAEERCCGVGAHLGYLFSQGDYVLLLDGDMQLAPEFLPAAVQFLQQQPQYAGVAGQVEMDDATSYEFKSRKQRLHRIYPLGDCQWLSGGGLYRRSVIEQIGYLTNRNLHAYEEADLGIRIRHAGYKLHRLAVPFFHHTSYTMGSLALLKFRWKLGYLFASGELVRSAWGQPYLREVLGVIRNELVFGLYLLLLLLALLVSAGVGNGWIAGVAVLPLLAFVGLKTVKNRSLVDALRSVLNLTVYAAGLARGLFLTPKSPREYPEHRVINP
ncbi:glycosyltransferase [Plesiomonas sp. PI-19]|uniref:glycosyltransferase family 2 protein n=1 Tax=Plesiomonas sp. PI-19 TaxID=2898798 RepID=UPI001F370167|nr:glycosyltransferase [Plesiomonas sp. PI-19]MCE5164099.1 glycosyltransferase [Plesiomonas sp. PI-19]